MPDIIERQFRYLAMLRIFERHIVNYCYSHSNGVEDAQDLSQDIMVLIWEKLDTLKPNSTPQQQNRWLYKVMRTAFVRHLWHKPRIKTIPLSAADNVANEEDSDGLEELLDCLNDDDRRLLEAYFQGYTHVEVAKAFGLSNEAARQRYHRIIKRLKKWKK